MSTFIELIDSKAAAIKAAGLRRKAALERAQALVGSAKRQQRSLTPAEKTDVDGVLAQVEQINREIGNLEHDKRTLESAWREELELIPLQQQRIPTGVHAPAYDQVARIGVEARTYRPDARDHGFLMDVARGHMFHDHASNERLTRHMHEEAVDRSGNRQIRAVTTTNFAGLVVPQYLTDLVAKRALALRPFANICTHHDMPAEGMTVNISRITTGTSTAVQSAENAAVSETGIDDTLLAINVQTIAGQQTMSRQAVERGTLAEETVIDDLMRSLYTTLDSTLLNQATNGLTNVAQAVTYTDASPTAAELWPKLFNAQANAEAVLLGNAEVTHVVMHSRRWNWLCSQVGTSWPFLANATTPTQSGGIIVTNAYGDGVRGVLSNGLKVVVDNNIATNYGTNEDEVYVVAADECHLWEESGGPVMIRAEQPSAASLGVLFVVYQYAAYTFARYTNGASKIGGTGLILPIFS